jgi:hypothetical protein
MKSHIEVYFLMITDFIRELMKSPEADLTHSDSNLQKFDVKIFPYLKLISLIVFIIVLGIVFKNILQISTSESKENLCIEKDSDKTKSCVITLPDEPEKLTTDNVALKLQGRIKRNPNPLNYNELFNANKNGSQKKKKNSLLIKSHYEEFIKNKKINDNKNENYNSKQEEKELTICAVDDLFEIYNPKQQTPPIEK